MQDSKFWRIVAVLAVAAMLYIGHGLHNGPADGLRLISTARAQGIMLGNNEHTILTTNPDGKSIHVWRQVNSEQVKFVSSAKAP